MVAPQLGNILKSGNGSTWFFKQHGGKFDPYSAAATGHSTWYHHGKAIRAQGRAGGKLQLDNNWV